MSNAHFWVILHALLSSADFFQNQLFGKNSFSNTSGIVCFLPDPNKPKGREYEKYMQYQKLSTTNFVAKFFQSKFM